LVSYPLSTVAGMAGLTELLADVFFPAECAGCGSRGAPICDACASTIKHAPPAPAPPGIDAWFACFAYDGVAREAVARLKYRNARASLPYFANAIAQRIAPVYFDCVTWAPTTVERKRDRGFDHGQLLAREVARRTNTPMRRLLTRTSNDQQTGRPIGERRRGPTFQSVTQKTPNAVLLVDDVATTGATLRAAARALRAAGTTTVIAATVARTPAPSDSHD
jgi:competence protein ComFC